ncbi:MAG: hypothetical protein ACI4EH_01590 [Oliverpabstia sp.]
MMGNSGKAIRQMANGLFIIQVVLTFFGAFKLARLAWDFNFGIFLVVLAVGVLLAYITNLFLSAFGELVENTQKSAELNQEILNALQNMNRSLNSMETANTRIKEKAGESVSDDLKKHSGLQEESQTITPTWIKESEQPVQDETEQPDLECLLTSIVENMSRFRNTNEVKNCIINHIRRTGEKCDGLLTELDKVIVNEKVYGEMLETTKKYVKSYLTTESKSGESKAVCPGCGMPINVESARFCKYCGEELRK